MDALYHFVFAIIAGLAIDLHKKHKLRVLILLSFIAVLIDIDHFFKIYRTEKILMFHNLFVVFLIPIMLFYAAYIYESERKSKVLQSYLLIVTIMLIGHLISDLFYGIPLQLLYPITTASYVITNKGIITIMGYAVTSREGIALAFYGMILFLAYFIEDFIYFFEKKHQSLKKAIKDTLRDIV